MSELDPQRLCREMSNAAKEARKARRRVKVKKSHFNKIESEWEELISIANEIPDETGDQHERPADLMPLAAPPAPRARK